MPEAEASKYERDFQYSKGSLAITPNNWFLSAWENLRANITQNMSAILTKGQKMVVIGVGESGFKPNIQDEIQTIGIDINKKALVNSKGNCDLIVASASHLPLKDNSVGIVFFELVLHHLKGQMSLFIPIQEAHRVLQADGQMVAIEPNMLNPSGFLLTLINDFHLYAALFGGSNYEYALTPKEICVCLNHFSCFYIKPLSFVSPRFPLFVQRYILDREHIFENYFSSFSWMIMVIAKK